MCTSLALTVISVRTWCSMKYCHKQAALKASTALAPLFVSAQCTCALSVCCYKKPVAFRSHLSRATDSQRVGLLTAVQERELTPHCAFCPSSLTDLSSARKCQRTITHNSCKRNITETIMSSCNVGIWLFVKEERLNLSQLACVIYFGM